MSPAIHHSVTRQPCASIAIAMRAGSVEVLAPTRLRTPVATPRRATHHCVTAARHAKSIVSGPSMRMASIESCSDRASLTKDMDAIAAAYGSAATETRSRGPMRSTAAPITFE
eukprot:scaffold9139_cov64-Phaeocystis_antarctica.AAC.16